MGRFSRGDDEEKASEMSDLLAIYNTVREEDQERDEQIKKTDFSKILTYIELCLELADKKSKYARKLIKLPNISNMLLLITKTQFSSGDKLIEAMESLINEYYDEPIHTPLLKFYYIDFLIEVLRRVNLDSRERADILKSIHKAGKLASGVFPEIVSDLKSYARGKYGEHLNEKPEKEIDDADKTVEQIEDEIYNEMVG